MEVLLENINKKFGRQKVIHELSQKFEDGHSYAILGGNGSGKSTLLQLVLGSLTPSSGNISYKKGDQRIKREDAAFRISMASPYLELIEELTAREFLSFYLSFRKLRPGMDINTLLERSMLTDSADKQIRHYSSGMRQRLRLGLALMVEADLILLDEPTSNLDPKGVDWYRVLLEEELEGRTLLIGSNFDTREMDFCMHELHISTE